MVIVKIYGYQVSKNGDDKRAGKMIINDEQTEVVKEVYRLYLSGVGMLVIANTLNSNGIKSATGKL